MPKPTTPRRHAPTHQLSENSTYFVTAGTYLKAHHFRTAQRLEIFRFKTDGLSVSDDNTVDVIAIQRFFLGLSTGIANTGRYLFNPPNRPYMNLMTSPTMQNYDALVFGDTASSFVELPDDASQGAARPRRPRSWLRGLQR